MHPAPVNPPVPLDDRVDRRSTVHYRNVLVPVDGSDRSAVALRTAHALSERFGAVLHTLAVSADADRLENARAAAASALGAATDDPRVHARHDSSESRAIVAVAGELGACLICMSTRAHGRFTGALLGSTDRTVIRTAHAPVVLIGPLADRGVYLDDAWPAPLAHPQVVVCVDAAMAALDGADIADRRTRDTVELAGAWAAALGMTLTVLSVAVPEIPLAADRAGAVRRRLGPVIDGLTAEGLDVAVHVELDPVSIAAGIETYLRANPAALLVLATHARIGLDRLLHRTTAASITASSTIGVVVVTSDS